MVSRRDLPPAVFDEADSFLWRARELEPALAGQLDRSRYEVWTFAPDFVDDEHLARIRSGHLEWEDRPEGTWEAILDYIVRRMETTSATWVVPDSVAKTTDAFFSRGEWSEHFAVGETPYYVVREPDRAAVERAWRDGGSAAGELGLLTLASVPHGNGTSQDLDAIATQMVDLAVEAYDHPARVVFFTATE